MLDMGKPRIGRPPLSRDGSTVVSIRLPNPRYDALITYANQRGEDVSEIIRRAIDACVVVDRRTPR